MTTESDLPEVIERVQTPAEAQAPEPEAVVPEPEAAPETEADAAEAPAAEEPEKDRKSPVAQLKGRVGHLTKTIHQKDEALAEAQRKIDMYEAALKGAGTPAEGDPTPPAPARTPPAPADFDAAVKAEAARIAAAANFTAKCNEVFEAGKKAFKDDFAESVDNLNATGLARQDVIEAAIATDAAPQVLHYLGQDLDEAARIAALSPAAMGVEMARLAVKLSAPPPKPAVSRAPAPITPVGGAANPSLDIYDPNISDDEYYERRAKQGAPYIRLNKRAG